MKHIVQPGETTYSIARLFRIRTEQLIAANPGIFASSTLSPGQSIEVPVNARMRQTIDINGYAYVEQSPEELTDIFPFLTFLSMLGCELKADGTFLCRHNPALIEAAWAAQVGPIMAISNYVQREGYSQEIAHAVLTSEEAQQRMIDGIIRCLTEVQYYGVLLDLEPVPFEDYDAYAALLQRLTFTLHPLGYFVMLTLRTKRVITRIQELIPGFPMGDYEFIADRFIFKSSELVCDPEADLSMPDTVQRILDFTTHPFSAQKILIAYPNCCEVWTLPVDENSMPQPMYYEQAYLKASQHQGFSYDPITNMQFIQFTDTDGIQYAIWCGNVCATKELAELLELYNLGGVSFRMADMFSLATYQLFNAVFNIRKIVL